MGSKKPKKNLLRTTDDELDRMVVKLYKMRDQLDNASEDVEFNTNILNLIEAAQTCLYAARRCIPEET